MGANGRADGGAQDAHLGVDALELGGNVEAVLRGIGVAHGGNVAVGLQLAVLLEVVGQLAHALLAAARHGADAQRAVQVEVEKCLDVQGVSDDGHALGQAAAAVQRVEVVHHEEGVDVVAGLLGPHGQLLGVEASVALGTGLVKEKREGGGGKQAVHHVDAHLLVGVLVLQAL